MPKDFNFLCRADLSIPIKSAVLEILPWFFFNCVVRYSFSKCSRASFKGDEKDFSISDSKIHGVDGLINIQGIESPGVTSSLAIGEYVKNLINSEDDPLIFL